MKFTKLQGAGNDFILVETGEMEYDWPERAVAMCERHFGIGADGLLLLLPSGKANFRMRIFNPDGSEAEACGNGLRCLVRYVLDRGLITKKTTTISIETEAGVRTAKINTAEKSAEIRVGLGAPEFSAKAIPVMVEEGRGGLVDIKSMLVYTITVDGKRMALNLVSMGNPHAVYFSQEPVAHFPLAQIGPKVERHKIFPRRTNFEVARVLKRDEIEARVWERGAGETLACGSGAAAITVAAQLHDFVGNKVRIKLPGRHT